MIGSTIQNERDNSDHLAANAKCTKTIGVVFFLNKIN